MDHSGRSDRRLQRALTRLPARMQAARRSFQQLTGFDAVISLTGAAPEAGRVETPSPPMHPTCVDRILGVGDLPCGDNWQAHLRATLASRKSHSHQCELGLLCACVPIYLGRHLVGVAKVVVDSDTSPIEFAAATATLGVTIATSCQAAYVSVLSEELESLQQRVAGFGRLITPQGLPKVDGEIPPGCKATIVDLALDHIHRHYKDCDLSLHSVAEALHCNGNYLTQRFTELVGQRMHGYILSLRIQRVCRELLQSDQPIKRIALESGFRGSGRMARVFHRQIGVSPGEYRRIFAGP